MASILSHRDLGEALRSAYTREGWCEEYLRSTAEVGQVLDHVVAAMTVEGYSAEDVFAVRLALEEALVNAVKHGNRSDPTKQARLRYRVGGDQVLVQVEDQGPGFNPAQVPSPILDENLDVPGGRGLFLIHSLMSWVRYNDRGNCVTLCKQRQD